MENERLKKLIQEITPLRQKLVGHPVYSSIKTLQHLQVFMEYHVFAVWDFMSLLKSLQIQLTCVALPWVPRGSADVRYLINEIVTGEESDVDQAGKRISHFELYLQAMQQSGCDTSAIDNFLNAIIKRSVVKSALKSCMAPKGVTNFVMNTFDVIELGALHEQVAVFTFGREDLIPGMFVSFVKQLNVNHSQEAGIFQYYLERHIEVDGDHHSHLAHQMTIEVCGDDYVKWQQATQAVQTALEARIHLWDSIVAQIKSQVSAA